MAAGGAAVATSAATTATVSAVNNRGNLGAVFKDVTSSDSLKGYVVTGLAAGFTAGVIDPNLGGKTQPYNNLTKGFDLSTLSGAGGFALHNGAQAVATGTISTVVKGGSLGDNLGNSLMDQAATVAAAISFHEVGTFVTAPSTPHSNPRPDT